MSQLSRDQSRRSELLQHLWERSARFRGRPRHVRGPPDAQPEMADAELAADKLELVRLRRFLEFQGKKRARRMRVRRLTSSAVIIAVAALGGSLIVGRVLSRPPLGVDGSARFLSAVANRGERGDSVRTARGMPRGDENPSALPSQSDERRGSASPVDQPGAGAEPPPSIKLPPPHVAAPPEGTDRPAVAPVLPRPGGELTFLVPAEPPSYDAHREETFALIHPAAPHYNTLLRIDPFDKTGTRVVGDLAESWAVSSDTRTYVLKLRRGVKFHDGRELTSRDVRACARRSRNPESISGISAPAILSSAPTFSAGTWSILIWISTSSNPDTAATPTTAATSIPSWTTST
jgi:predicted DNA-binding protein (UPF0251 family)